MALNKYLDIAPEVQKALDEGRPVVALESTIISHGMPYPQNVETALKVEQIIRDSGAVPATIAILGGRLKAGLTAEEIEYLGKKGQDVTKASRRDLAVLVSRKADGATTVTTTMMIAHMAGIQVFATGGIGGVHRGAETTMDISADLEELAGVLKDTNAMVLSDEIYAELTYGQKHVSPANLPELYDRTIVVNGFSKSHAMTGWRMGYVCGPAPILQQMLKLHQFGIMSAPTTSQYAAIEAMRNGDVDIEKMRDEYDGRRRYLVEGLRRIGLPCFEPKGAFYVFPDIRGTGLTSDEFCERFLMEEKVAVISGAAFGPGGEGFIRCCYATSMKDIAEALTRMDNFLTNLRKKQAREG